MQSDNDFVTPIGDTVPDAVKQRCENLQEHLTRLSEHVSNIHDHETDMLALTDLLGEMRQLFCEMFNIRTINDRQAPFAYRGGADLEQDSHDFNEWAVPVSAADADVDEWGCHECDDSPAIQSLLHRLRRGTEAKHKAESRIEKLNEQLNAETLKAPTEKCNQSVLHSFANQAYKHTELLACAACACMHRKTFLKVNPSGGSNTESSGSDGKDGGSQSFDKEDNSAENMSVAQTRLMSSVFNKLRTETLQNKKYIANKQAVTQETSNKKRKKTKDTIASHRMQPDFTAVKDTLEQIIQNLETNRPADNHIQQYNKSISSILKEFRKGLQSIELAWQHTTIMYNTFASGIEEIAGVRVEKLEDDATAQMWQNLLQHSQGLLQLAQKFSDNLSNSQGTSMQEFESMYTRQLVVDKSRMQADIENIRMQIISNTQLWSACERVFADIHERHPHLRNCGLTVGLLMDIKRNSLWSQYQRLVGLDWTMCRRLSGIKVTFASDYRRIANQYRITMFIFANSSVVDVDGTKYLATKSNLQQSSETISLDAQLFNVVQLWNDLAVL